MISPQRSSRNEFQESGPIIKFDDDSTADSAEAAISSDNDPEPFETPEGSRVLQKSLLFFTECVAEFLAGLVELDSCLSGGEASQPRESVRDCVKARANGMPPICNTYTTALNRWISTRERWRKIADTASKAQYVVQEQRKKVEANSACIDALQLDKKPEEASRELARLIRDLAGADAARPGRAEVGPVTDRPQRWPAHRCKGEGRNGYGDRPARAASRPRG